MDVKRNLSMLMDFYELTMSNGYFKKEMKDEIAVFDMFYRNNPDDAARKQPYGKSSSVRKG